MDKKEVILLRDLYQIPSIKMLNKNNYLSDAIRLHKVP